MGSTALLAIKILINYEGEQVKYILVPFKVEKQ
jgi:hypothetical protein